MDKLYEDTDERFVPHECEYGKKMLQIFRDNPRLGENYERERRKTFYPLTALIFLSF